MDIWIFTISKSHLPTMESGNIAWHFTEGLLLLVVVVVAVIVAVVVSLLLLSLLLGSFVLKI